MLLLEPFTWCRPKYSSPTCDPDKVGDVLDSFGARLLDRELGPRLISVPEEVHVVGIGSRVTYELESTWLLRCVSDHITVEFCLGDGDSVDVAEAVKH